MRSDVTRILSAIDAGDPRASEELLPLVYAELRKLADSRLARERPGQTLQATALVHEAYLRLVGPTPEGAEGTNGAPRWDGKGHFFAAASEAMRRILVDRARARATAKRGGDWRRVDLDVTRLAEERPGELLALDEALSALRREDPEKARLVELRFFAGLTIEQAADALGISTATAGRHWAYARAWLFDALGGESRRAEDV
ncbi:MAG: ECF-type sigma factor [Planctomycetota bacterium]